MISGIGALDKISGNGGTESLDAFPGGTVATPAAIDPGASFANAVTEAANRTIGTLEHAEQLSVQALQGDVQTREVVDAVMSAEQSLQAAVAIRDKIVTAYLEVSRMAI